MVPARYNYIITSDLCDMLSIQLIVDTIDDTLQTLDKKLVPVQYST